MGEYCSEDDIRKVPWPALSERMAEERAAAPGHGGCTAEAKYCAVS